MRITVITLALLAIMAGSSTVDSAAAQSESATWGNSVVISGSGGVLAGN